MLFSLEQRNVYSSGHGFWSLADAGLTISKSKSKLKLLVVEYMVMP